MADATASASTSYPVTCTRAVRDLFTWFLPVRLSPCEREDRRSGRGARLFLPGLDGCAERLRAHEPREDHDALGRAVERVARAEDEPVIALAVDDPHRVGADDALALHAIGEAAVGHGHGDRVALAQAVDVAEGRAVGRAVPGDGHGAGRSGERRLRVRAGPLAQVAGIG